jgi:methionyl-tRNA formyltransferase
MKVLILTSSLNGTAAHHLAALLKEPTIQIDRVIYSQGIPKSKYKKAIQKLKKIFKIGLLGAINGIKMRKWFHADISKYVRIENIAVLCSENNIPFFKTTSINSEHTVELFKASGADIGLSLGNGYISRKVFTILPYGMLNIHHEILPTYQNAQSVIWQIYNGSKNTGYTIHKINEKIDSGEIIYQQQLPIIFKESLADTVTNTYVQLLEQSAKGLITVLMNYESYLKLAKPQGIGNTYTTPSYKQFLKMNEQFNNLKTKFN